MCSSGSSCPIVAGGTLCSSGSSCPIVAGGALRAVWTDRSVCTYGSFGPVGSVGTFRSFRSSLPLRARRPSLPDIAVGATWARWADDRWNNELHFGRWPPQTSWCFSMDFVDSDLVGGQAGECHSSSLSPDLDQRCGLQYHGRARRWRLARRDRRVRRPQTGHHNNDRVSRCDLIQWSYRSSPGVDLKYSRVLRDEGHPERRACPLGRPNHQVDEPRFRQLDRNLCQNPGWRDFEERRGNTLEQNLRAFHVRGNGIAGGGECAVCQIPAGDGDKGASRGDREVGRGVAACCRVD